VLLERKRKKRKIERKKRKKEKKDRKKERKKERERRREGFFFCCYSSPWDPSLLQLSDFVCV